MQTRYKNTMERSDFTSQVQTLQDIADKQLAAQQAETEAELESKRSEQIASGTCNIVPFPKKIKTKPFRSELTIEQSSLFVANRFKGDYFTREWTVRSSEDPKDFAIHKLSVGKTDKEERTWGVLKQVHQDAFYRLLQLWGEKGYPLGTIDKKTYGSFTISAYELVKSLRGADGNHHYRRTRTILHELAAIPIVLEVDRSGQEDSDRKQFTLLSDARWNELQIDKRTRRPKQGGKSEVTILFSPMVTKGFLDKHYKTLLGTSYRSLGSPRRGGRGELARLLYPYLDSQLATKTNFHIKLRSLAERFGLTQHSKMSYRKRQFTPAVNVLNGKPIKSEDHILRVHLRESTEEDDYILVAKREPNRQLRLFKEDEQ